MTTWVKSDLAKPPASMSVLLSIATFSDEGDYQDSIVLCGCYSHELEEDYEGWFIDSFYSQKRFIEDKNNIVMGWTLIPEPASPDSFIIKMKLDKL